MKTVLRGLRDHFAGLHGVTAAGRDAEWSTLPRNRIGSRILLTLVLGLPLSCEWWFETEEDHFSTVAAARKDRLGRFLPPQAPETCHDVHIRMNLDSQYCWARFSCSPEDFEEFLAGVEEIERDVVTNPRMRPGVSWWDYRITPDASQGTEAAGMRYFRASTAQRGPFSGDSHFVAADPEARTLYAWTE